MENEAQSGSVPEGGPADAALSLLRLEQALDRIGLLRQAGRPVQSGSAVPVAEIASRLDGLISRVRQALAHSPLAHQPAQD